MKTQNHVTILFDDHFILLFLILGAFNPLYYTSVFLQLGITCVKLSENEYLIVLLGLPLNILSFIEVVSIIDECLKFFILKLQNILLILNSIKIISLLMHVNASVCTLLISTN